MRIQAMAKRCKTRGGDCPCTNSCEAVLALHAQIQSEKRAFEDRIRPLQDAMRRLTSPLATLKEGFQFDPRYTPVMSFDGCEEATFGYEDENGDWIDAGVWPFNESYVWFDDCEHHGIKVD